MVKIELATTTQHFIKIATLADIIWREHYIPIVGKPQIDYMLKKIQSVEAIKAQIETGFEYYLINFENTPVGYISIKSEQGVLFLSKIYVLKPYRGRKIGKLAIQFVENKTKEYQLKSIRLTVNVNNTSSIKAYEKLGFKNIGPQVTDIGNGFIMDDYQMIKNI